MYVENVRNWLSEEFSEDVVVLNIPAFDNSIVGVSTDHRVIYDYSKMIKELSHDAKISEDDAEDFINFNTLGSIISVEESKRPIIMMNIYQGEKMINIRRNIFETNSSSTHTVTLCSRKDFTDWEEDKVFWCKDTETFTTPRELIVSMSKKSYYKDTVEKLTALIEQYGEYSPEVAEYMCEECYCFTYAQYDQYIEDNSYEEFSDSFTTKSGEEVVCFGYYGYDG